MRFIIDILVKRFKISAFISVAFLTLSLFLISIPSLIANIRSKDTFGIKASVLLFIGGVLLAIVLKVWANGKNI